jgi:hypothetical protein
LQSEKYRLQVAGSKSNGNSVTAGMIVQSGMMFSTFDQDNDNYTFNCAERFQGGWW